MGSANWRWSLDLSNLALERATRLSKGLSVVSRNCNSNKRRIARTKIAWATWLTSSNKRSRPTSKIEEAEEIAALNFAKYRKGQQELEETEERAKMAGVQLETLR